MSERAKQQFLETYDHEFATTMRVLRAYPEDKLDLKPSEKSNKARDLAWTFALESGLGVRVWHDEFAKGVKGDYPKQPENWNDLLATIETMNKEYRALIANASVQDLEQEVHFFVAPKKMGPITRMNWIWFLLHDQIHHRGQFSVYLRMAGGKLPSIYGPTADEPWM